jgi:hypothetical protein
MHLSLGLGKGIGCFFSSFSFFLSSFPFSNKFCPRRQAGIGIENDGDDAYCLMAEPTD